MGIMILKVWIVNPYHSCWMFERHCGVRLPWFINTSGFRAGSACCRWFKVSYIMMLFW